MRFHIKAEIGCANSPLISVNFKDKGHTRFVFKVRPPSKALQNTATYIAQIRGGLTFIPSNAATIAKFHHSSLSAST